MTKSSSPRKPLVGLTVIERLNWVSSAVFIILAGWCYMIGTADELVAGTIFLAFAVSTIFAAFGLNARKNWGRRLTLYLTALAVLSVGINLFLMIIDPWGRIRLLFLGPIYLVVLPICFWIMRYLFRPQVKEAFGVGRKSHDSLPHAPDETARQDGVK